MDVIIYKKLETITLTTSINTFSSTDDLDKRIVIFRFTECVLYDLKKRTLLLIKLLLTSVETIRWMIHSTIQPVSALSDLRYLEDLVFLDLI